MTDVSNILKTINEAINSLPGNLKEEDRLAILAATGKLQEKLETPLEAFIRFMFGVFQGVGLRLADQVDLLKIAVAAQGPVTVDELAAGSSADPNLVRRIARLITAMKLFEEKGKDTYLASPLAAAFVSPSPLEAGIKHIGTILPVVAALPEYFAEKGFKDPSDAFDGPFQYTKQTKDHYFDWLAKKPALQQAFNTVMTVSRLARGEEWFDFYPVVEKLQVKSLEDILLVDIGGGIGHDVIAFKNRFPDNKGKLIVEDLPAVTAEVKDLPAGIETVGHNFFQPQPSSLGNARAYYLRTVLHDWPDKEAKIILEHIRTIMAKDSILLINENAIPDSNVPLYSVQLDFNMMACFSSLDRTEQQFTDLLESAGFALVKVWRPKVVLPGSAVLFEAVLKD